MAVDAIDARSPGKVAGTERGGQFVVRAAKLIQLSADRDDFVVDLRWNRLVLWLFSLPVFRRNPPHGDDSREQGHAWISRCHLCDQILDGRQSFSGPIGAFDKQTVESLGILAKPTLI